MKAGYFRRASPIYISDIRHRGRVSPAFVTTAARKSRLVVDYTVVNDCLEDRTFRIDQLSDLAPSLRRDDCLFKADIQDAYYHLRLRNEDQLYLSFSVDGVLYVPACLNCGLAVAPWFFIKAMRPVDSFLRARGNRVFSYMDDFFGAEATVRKDHPATKVESRRVGRDVHELFSRIGLTLHPTKSHFEGWRELEILWILVDTLRAGSTLSREAAQGGECGARTARACITQSAARPRALPPRFRGSW
jgi:hypothetical protein